MTTALQGIRACVFDAYGTLFDVGSAALRWRAELGPQAQPLAALWRDKQLQYTWLRAVQGRHADFQQVTRDALDFALESLRIDVPGLPERLLQAYDCLDAYAEVADVLARIKRSGCATAILSNGTPAMLAALVRHAAIGAHLDAVISVEEVGVFKPAAAVYQRAVDRLRVAPEAICFVSSNGWDAYGASAFGLRVVWCNRYGQRAERLPGAPEAQIASLVDLPALLA